MNADERRPIRRPPALFVHEGGGDFGILCKLLAQQLGFDPTAWLEPAPEVAIAPLLTRKLPRREYAAPRLGTLIFHPSALPYRRGPDAIRHTVAAGERVSAATWFWCDEGLDTGDICEQEPVVLLPGESAGRAYHTRFCPAGLTALRRALLGILAGEPRRIRQDEALATYDHALAQSRSPEASRRG